VTNVIGDVIAQEIAGNKKLDVMRTVKFGTDNTSIIFFRSIFIKFEQKNFIVPLIQLIKYSAFGS
jgi:hypothetical protein